MAKSKVRFTCFPKTQPPPAFAAEIVTAFDRHYDTIGTEKLSKCLTSDAVLTVLQRDLLALGFQLETGKTKGGLVDRPVFFGEYGVPELRYRIDGYHPTWRCGLEIEAGRGWMGNAVYRDLVQAMVMVDVDHLCLAVSNAYRYNSGGKPTVSRDYEATAAVVSALYGHSRLRMPFGLTLIGY